MNKYYKKIPPTGKFKRTFDINYYALFEDKYHKPKRDFKISEWAEVADYFNIREVKLREHVRAGMNGWVAKLKYNNWVTLVKIGNTKKGDHLVKWK